MSLLKGCLSFLALSVVPTLTQAQNTPYPVTGLTGGIKSTGERPYRLNINTVYNNGNGGPAWDLFIQGLMRLQYNVSESNWQSYFQIAGIHGRPYISWNNVGPVRGGSGGGYCPHGTVQFPTWHRPYLALYEQLIGAQVQMVASQYTGSNRAAYQAAAQSWRLPYWDWASNYNLPAAATQQQVTINGPNGRMTVNNPLYQYKWQTFPLNSASNYFPHINDPDTWQWPQTTRQPDNNGVDQNAMVNTNLEDDDNPLKGQVYRVFQSSTTFEAMASTDSNGMSFESPHNDVHNSFGSVMASLDYSAFDPIFWLHHCNIDRLFAMWQAINYNNPTQTQNERTTALYATAGNSIVNANSPLKPFYRDTKGNFHTGVTVALIKSFGYSYPEIMDWTQSQVQLSKNVTASVNLLYGSGAPGSPTNPNTGNTGNTGSSSSSPSQSPTPSSTGNTGSSSSSPSPSPTPSSTDNTGSSSSSPSPSPTPSSTGGSDNNGAAQNGNSNSGLPWWWPRSTASSGSSSLPWQFWIRSESQPQARDTSAPDGTTFATTNLKAYYVKIGVERSELPLPCTINIYLGSLSAGHMTVLGMPKSGMTYSEVALQKALTASSDVTSTDDSVVIPILEKQLRCDIIGNDGTVVSVDSVPSLTVHVESEAVVPASNIDEFPAHSAPTSYPNIGKTPQAGGDGSKVGGSMFYKSGKSSSS